MIVPVAHSQFLLLGGQCQGYLSSGGMVQVYAYRGNCSAMKF